MKHYLELLGDTFIFLFGALLVYIFIIIEVYGGYGQEPNAIIRRVEMYMGLPMMALGIWHFIKDVREIKRWRN